MDDDDDEEDASKSQTDDDKSRDSQSTMGGRDGCKKRGQLNIRKILNNNFSSKWDGFIEIHWCQDFLVTRPSAAMLHDRRQKASMAGFQLEEGRKRERERRRRGGVSEDNRFVVVDVGWGYREREDMEEEEEEKEDGRIREGRKHK